MLKSFVPSLKRLKPGILPRLPSLAGRGQAATEREQAHGRIRIAAIAFLTIYAIIGGRLAWFGMQDLASANGFAAGDRTLASRPDIVDRSGEVLATDVRVASLYAEPRRIIDADEAVELLSSVLPDLDYEKTHAKLKSGSGFAWLKREITPKQQAEVLALGIPGIGFRSEKRRFYPGGPTASHIVGLVNVDNQGIAGLEKFIDDNGLSALQDAGLAAGAELEPVRTSIDNRVQHIVRDELAAAMERYSAIAAGATIIDVHTGEVLAMASLPDYDPNNPFNALEKDRLNRMSAGTFEMGSTFKAFTTAMALDSGLVKMTDSFDASRPIQIARFTINDFHGKGRRLSVPEIFIYSSNIGTAKMADKVGTENHRAFLKKIGLLDRMNTELPEVARPTEPREWKKLNSITISFGHGVSTTPLQTAVAAATLMNGGKLIDPTFLPRSRAEADEIARQVISQKTSEDMRYLFRLNVEKGSGRRAEVAGFEVGGKTGTAEKVVNGRYSSAKRFNAFLSAFPISDP